MKLPNSAKEALARVFYDLGQSPEAIDDLMSVLKIFDFRWDAKNQVLIDDNTEEVFSEKKAKKDSPWEVIPIKNLSNFDLDCLERVLNTRVMKKIDSPLGLNPLFECLGWTIKLSGDTYRLHFVGGTDYWESHDPHQWDKEWTDPASQKDLEDYLNEVSKEVQDYLDKCMESLEEETDGEDVEDTSDILKTIKLSYPLRPNLNWDPNGEIPKEWK